MRRPAADARAVHDAAKILPVAAAILLLPPFILIFAAPATIAGVPLIIVYVFGIWAVIVVAAWLVARRVEPPDGPDITSDIEEPPQADVR
jgi:hypothetical protein